MRIIKRSIGLVICVAITLSLIACSSAGDPNNLIGAIPSLPEKIKEFKDNIPIINVYIVKNEKSEEMHIEEYLEGVLAGEMQNDWPLEALKAQAILARTYALRYMTEKESKYEGADLSTDIEEAQAYDAAGVNETIKKAIEETRGIVLSSNGEFPYAWFHAHSGGKTALAKEGLEFEGDEPTYTQVTDGRESDKAPTEAKEWSASFTKAEIMKAASLDAEFESIEIGSKGESGRAETLVINGKEVSAPSFRLAIGSTVMRSTLIDDISVEGDSVTISGRGYGHGVGMPQWGAYGMAETGATCEEILLHYFRDVSIVKVY